MIKRILILMAVLSVVASCAPGSSLPTMPPTEAGPYRLGPGDQVRIIVFGQQEMTGDYRVGDSGSISLPLLGVVEADGKTIKELETSIEKSLAQGYVVDPSVSVEILAYRPFYILGEVQKPGQYPYAGAGMTVLTAVTVGGGFTFRAEQDYVSITRKNEEGKPVEFRAPRDAIVKPGDVIYVFERFF